MNDSNIRIDTDFPGGNVILHRIEQDVVHITPDLRDTEGHWFYWYFRVRGAAGRTLKFQFPDVPCVGTRGAAISNDQGQTWHWGGADTVEDESFTHCFADDADDVRLAMGIPYVTSDLDAWLSKHADHPRLQRGKLCTSLAGADVPLLRVNPTGRAKHGFMLTARHHACEAMANYVLEGIVDAALEDEWYAENVLIWAIPLVDYDGVQAGDQGKNRKPHDHNRDYIDGHQYPETAAIRQLASDWNDPPIALDYDLHCPFLRGADCNLCVYQVGSSDQTNWQQQMRFGKILEQVHQGELPYRAEDDLPFGQSWNTGKSYGHNLCSHSQWMIKNTPVRHSGSFEIPYADARGVAILPDNVRELGRSIAEAAKQFLITAE